MVEVNSLSMGSQAAPLQEEGQWCRADGTAVEYFNWHEFEANNYLGKEHYIVTWKNGQWNDMNDFFVFDECTNCVEECRHTVHIVCEQDKPECCTTDDIVLECSSSQVKLNVQRCFFEQLGISSSSVFVGEDASISACQGAIDGLRLFLFELKLTFLFQRQRRVFVFTR